MMNKDQTESDSDHSVTVHYGDNVDRQNHITQEQRTHIFLRSHSLVGN